MSEDLGKFEKFDFTSDGEVVSYISCEQAAILAMRLAREDSNFYSPDRAGTTFVWTWIKLAWEVISCEEGEDFYDVRLAFRPSGRFSGRPGIEQFIIDKAAEYDGDWMPEVRQVLDEPSGLGLCPKCGDRDVRPRYKRHWVRKWRCNRCNSIFSRPRISI